MNKLTLVLLLTLVGCKKSEYYLAPKQSCDVRPTWVQKEIVEKKCVAVGKNGCGYRKTVRRTRYEYEYNCRWKEFRSDKPSK